MKGETIESNVAALPALMVISGGTIPFEPVALMVPIGR
jgi:hypothetical protein